MVEIGKDVRRTLQMKPAEFWIREDLYYTYACKNCEQETGEANIVKAAKEPALLSGSFASAEAVAYLAAQKFVMHSPLYRLEQEFNRQGLKLSRQTMANCSACSEERPNSFFLDSFSCSSSHSFCSVRPVMTCACF